MIPDAASVNEIVQHAVVSAVALGAVAVVLRRVLGVFETRPANPSGSGSGPGSASQPYPLGTGQPTPGCSHCASGTTARRKHASH